MVARHPRAPAVLRNSDLGGEAVRNVRVDLAARLRTAARLRLSEGICNQHAVLSMIGIARAGPCPTPPRGSRTTRGGMYAVLMTTAAPGQVADLMRELPQILEQLEGAGST